MGLMVLMLMMRVLTFITMMILIMILMTILMMIPTMILKMILMMILMMVGAGTCILSKFFAGGSLVGRRGVVRGWVATHPDGNGNNGNGNGDNGNSGNGPGITYAVRGTVKRQPPHSDNVIYINHKLDR